MSIAERAAFQIARVKFFNVRNGWGRAITRRDGRRVYIPLQALHDAGLVTLEPGAIIEVALDEIDQNHVERVRLTESAVEEKPKPVPKKHRA